MAGKKHSKLVVPSETPPQAPDPGRIRLDRLMFFNDSVFAIAITLLALEIRLPATNQALTDAELGATLLAMVPKFMAYIISFLVIGSFWIAYHRKFQYIQRSDRSLLTLNLLILMVVDFIPFPSSMVSENGGLTATIFYALTVALIGVLFAILWAYASRRARLIDPALPNQLRRRELIIPLVTSSIFLLSIGIAYLDTGIARLTWFFMLPVSLLLNRG